MPGVRDPVHMLIAGRDDGADDDQRAPGSQWPITPPIASPSRILMTQIGADDGHLDEMIVARLVGRHVIAVRRRVFEFAVIGHENLQPATGWLGT